MIVTVGTLARWRAHRSGLAALLVAAWMVTAAGAVVADDATLKPPRIGILFGTFDPPHVGHIESARLAATRMALDRVYLIPNQRPSDKPQASAFVRRLWMTELAVEGHDQLATLSRGTLLWAWTRTASGDYVDGVLAVLRARHPGSDLVHVVGTDSLTKMARKGHLPGPGEDRMVAVVIRPDNPVERTSLVEEAIDDGRVQFVGGSGRPISSTRVRRAAGRLEPLGQWVAPGVERYIRFADLYRNP